MRPHRKVAHLRARGLFQARHGRGAGTPSLRPIAAHRKRGTSVWTAISSAFATVRLRQRVTKGAGSRTKNLMPSEPFEMAEDRWRWHQDGGERLVTTANRASVLFGSPHK